MTSQSLMHPAFPGPVDANGGVVDHDDVHVYSAPMGVSDDFATGAFAHDEDRNQEQEDFSGENPTPKRDRNHRFGHREDQSKDSLFKNVNRP